MGLSLDLALPCISLSYSLMIFLFRLSTFETVFNFLQILHLIIPLNLVVTALLSDWLISSIGVEEVGPVLKTSIATLSCAVSFSAWFHCVRGQKYVQRDMSGKVCVVTGANAGIGLETARELARMGATVVLGCRSESKALKAIEDIVSSIGNKAEFYKRVLFIGPLDLSSLDSVTEFADSFLQHEEFKGKPLDVLINNAGIMMHRRAVTADGAEATLAANHLGHARLALLLLPALALAAAAGGGGGGGGRLVNVSSSLYHATKSFDFEDPQTEKGYEMFKAYSKSKLAQVLFQRHLARALAEARAPVAVVAVHPGMVRTEITRNMHWLMRLGDLVTHPIWMVLRKSPAQGAFTTLHAATSPKLNGHSDLYLEHCAATAWSRAARAPAAAAAAFALTLDLADGPADGRAAAAVGGTAALRGAGRCRAALQEVCGLK